MATAQLSQTCHGVARHLPLCHVLDWSPFRIDALGLVTMIGAEEVSANIGRLVRSRFTEYLPLLGAYIVANDGFTESISGFQFYNLSNGMFTNDMAGWFQRWLLAQEFPRAGGTVTWTLEQDFDADPIKEKDREAQWTKTLWRTRWDTLLALLIGTIANCGLLALTILQGDWWGLANAISMVLSIFVRAYTTNQNRKALDTAVVDSDKDSKNGDPPLPGQARCLIVLNDNHLVTMFAPAKVIKNVFIDKPEPPNPFIYKCFRALGWIAFSGHVITLGMSGLATQMVTVFLIVVPTVITVMRWGSIEDVVGTKLRALIDKPPQRSNTRQDAYIALNMSKKEEISMQNWNLVPHIESSEKWWNGYYSKKEALFPQGYLPLKSPTGVRLPPRP